MKKTALFSMTLTILFVMFVVTFHEANRTKVEVMMTDSITLAILYAVTEKQ